jgi:hypothetical protein
MNYGVPFTCTIERFQARINGTQELLSKPETAALVPNVGFGEVFFGLGAMTSLAAIPAANSALDFIPGES